jgi:hypothetical protein
LEINQGYTAMHDQPIIKTYFCVRMFAVGDEKFCATVNVERLDFETSICIETKKKYRWRKSRVSRQNFWRRGELLACDLYSRALKSALTAVGQCFG